LLTGRYGEANRRILQLSVAIALKATGRSLTRRLIRSLHSAAKADKINQQQVFRTIFSVLRQLNSEPQAGKHGDVYYFYFRLNKKYNLKRHHEYSRSHVYILGVCFTTEVLRTELRLCMGVTICKRCARRFVACHATFLERHAACKVVGWHARQSYWILATSLTTGTISRDGNVAPNPS
jgi:hypothetical protein